MKLLLCLAASAPECDALRKSHSDFLFRHCKKNETQHFENVNECKSSLKDETLDFSFLSGPICCGTVLSPGQHLTGFVMVKRAQESPTDSEPDLVLASLGLAAIGLHWPLHLVEARIFQLMF